jgi:hypothetical protein
MQVLIDKLCKWWNDLLSKDSLITNQIEKNSLLQEDYSKKEMASYLGYLELIKWSLFHVSLQNNPYYGVGALATSGNQLKILKWIKINSGKIFQEFYCIAAGNGNLKILKWLKIINVPFGWISKHVYTSAVYKGHLNVLKWFINNGGSWNEDICSLSQKYEDIQAYLHSLPLESRPCTCQKV